MEAAPAGRDGPGETTGPPGVASSGNGTHRGVDRQVTATIEAPPSREATTPSNTRDPALDFLRSIALGRVVLWHVFAAVWMTWIAAIPVMFFVAGALLVPSLAKRGYRSTLHARLRRLLFPLWIYGAAVALTTLRVEGSGPVRLDRVLLWMLPLFDPKASAWNGGWLTNHLWYLRAYLWMLVLAPVLLAMARRIVRWIPVLLAAVAALELARHVDVPLLSRGQTRIVIGDVFAYGVFVVLGMAYAVFRPRLRPRLLAAGAALAALGAVTYAATAGLPNGDVNSSYPAIVLTGLAWLFGVGALERYVRRVAAHPIAERSAKYISGRALTIYLWHPAAIVVASAIVKLDGAVGWILVVALTVMFTGVAVLVIGWVEDLSARRGRVKAPSAARLITGFRHARLASFVGVVAVVLGVALPVVVPVPVPANAGTDTAAPSATSPAARAVRRPPSYREALADDAFAARTGTVAPAAGVTTAVATTVLGAAPGPASVPSTSALSPASSPSSGPVGGALGRDGPWPAAATTNLRAALDRWIVEHPEVTSIAVVVSRDGQQWHGDAHKAGAQRAAHVRDGYNVQSLTKTFTLALVLQAADEGKLDLSAPVPRLEALEGADAGVTITPTQLLKHSSGLPDYTTAVGFDPDATITPLEAVVMSLRSPLVAPTGTKVHYANTNYLYLGLLLEQIHGQTYVALLEELREKVGLTQTTLSVKDRRGWTGWSAGGIHSTLPELARWGTVLFTPGALLSTPSVERLTTVTENNLGAGTWPVCPCSTDVDGTRRYMAIGHHVGNGGLYWYPASAAVVALRIEPVRKETPAVAADLGAILSNLLP